MRNSATGLSQRLHIYYHCGISPKRPSLVRFYGLNSIMIVYLERLGMCLCSLEGFGEAGGGGVSLGG